VFAPHSAEDDAVQNRITIFNAMRGLPHASFDREADHLSWLLANAVLAAPYRGALTARLATLSDAREHRIRSNERRRLRTTIRRLVANRPRPKPELAR
jgi:hypothetical protein